MHLFIVHNSFFLSLYRLFFQHGTQRSPTYGTDRGQTQDLLISSPNYINQVEFEAQTEVIYLYMVDNNNKVQANYGKRDIPIATEGNNLQFVNVYTDDSNRIRDLQFVFC